MKQTTFAITPKPPYDFDLTAGYVTYFRGRYGADIFEDGLFRRLIDVNGGRLALVSVRSAGTVDSPVLEAQLQAPDLDAAAIEEARRQLSWILGVDDNLAPFYDMALADSNLAPVVEAMRGLHVAHTASAYEALVLAILGQQISSHVARILRTLLIETYGPSVEVDGEVYHTFPRPEALVRAGVEGLRAIKFSQRKSEYIVDIASRVASGELDVEALRGRPGDEVFSTLTALRGVGPWTVHWLMIRALGHTDGFPYGDLALQRMMGVLVNGGTPMTAQQALDYSERWSPYRSYVTTYLFAAVRSGRLGTLPLAGM